MCMYTYIYIYIHTYSYVIYIRTNLSAWRPIITTNCIFMIYMSIGIAFVIIGAVVARTFLNIL